MSKILYFEDDDSLAELAKRKLEKAGHQVQILLTGEKALEKVSAFQPDLILLDVLLPVMDGFSSLKRLKADQKLQSIPVILMTALGEKEDVVNGIKLGASNYLLKPFLPKVMLERVNQALEGKK